MSVTVQEENIVNLFFKHPANILYRVQTEFVKKLIQYKEDLFDILPQRIVWCYKDWQPVYNILQERKDLNIRFILGIPNDDDDIVTDTSETHLIVLDDMGDNDLEKIQTLVYEERSSQECKCCVHHTKLVSAK